MFAFSWSAFVLLLTIAEVVPQKVPRLNTKYIIKEGDVYLALLADLHGQSPSKKCYCMETDIRPSGLLMLEAFIYTVNQINARLDVLPNITLGYLYGDTCSTNIAFLAQAKTMLQDSELNYAKGQNLTVCRKEKGNFTILGFIEASGSSSSVTLNPYLGMYDIPSVALFSTSDELSDKDRYPYYLRVVPPDKFQAEGMVAFARHYNWTYVSLLFSEGSYGENGAKQIERITEVEGLCIDFSHRVSSTADSEEWSYIIKSLEKLPNAKAIFLFMTRRDIAEFFVNIEQSSLTRIYIGSDTTAWVSELLNVGLHYALNGVFYLMFPTRDDPEFLKYFYGLGPKTGVNENPWFNDIWTYYLQDNTEAHNFSSLLNTTTTWTHSDFYSKVIDGVYTYAFAIDSLIQAKCPHATRDLASCVTGDKLLAYLKNTSFEGLTDHIQFDKNGDMIGQYIVNQLSYNGDLKKTPVHTWDVMTKSFNNLPNSVNWKLWQNDNGHYVDGIPVSVCSHPCGPRQFYVQLELHCCWECRDCRVNEIVAVNRSMCEPCSLLTWPDAGTGETCSYIKQTYLKWEDPVAAGLVASVAVGLFVTVVILIVYVMYRKERLIKATSKEMSLLILSGCILALVTSILFLTPPSYWVCNLGLAGYHLSVTLIYAPLTIKASRIYRIFSAGKKGLTKPKMVSSKFQLLFVATIIAIQVGSKVVLITHNV